MTARKISDRQLVTEAGLREELAAAGIEPGMTLVVHSSLGSLGWVPGGAPAVVRALIDLLGSQGTLCMPAATPLCADPATWSGWEIPNDRLAELREHLPLFDRRTTPTSLGAIPETFRNWPGTVRSDHPLESVCARGPLASELTAQHPLAFSEGPGTPFGGLLEAGAWVLLLGIGFNRCTALHLAETLAQKRRTTTVRYPALRDGHRVWVEVENVADDNDTHFPIIGDRFVSAGHAQLSSVGEAEVALFRIQDLVRFAVRYFDDLL